MFLTVSWLSLTFANNFFKSVLNFAKNVFNQDQTPICERKGLDPNMHPYDENSLFDECNYLFRTDDEAQWPQVDREMYKDFPKDPFAFCQINYDGTSMDEPDYDYHQDVARASFADMLHDTERNQKYEQALILAIKEMHSRGKKANVLDIGTGTGLLAMMAARNGADSVIACEAFRPMSDLARKIIERNNFGRKIRVIPKRSSDLLVGIDFEKRCNILVTELFDTELIGEGAWPTIWNAHVYLLEPDSIVVPSTATIYIQVVECPLARRWNKIEDFHSDDGTFSISVPDPIKACKGSSVVNDLQLSQLPEDSFNTIISPVPVLEFQWWSHKHLPFRKIHPNCDVTKGAQFTRATTYVTRTKAERDGTIHAIFMWWDLKMDMKGEIILSCAPRWAHPSTLNNKNAEIPWRDHWMQSICYIPEMKVRKNQVLEVISCHDKYSLWFTVADRFELDRGYLDCRPCTCTLHDHLSFTRVGQINDTVRNKKYMSLFETHIDSESTVLIISEQFFLGLYAAKLAKKVYVLNVHPTDSFLEQFIKHNGLDNVEIISDFDKLDAVDLSAVDVVLSEPYFRTSLLPWHNLEIIHVLKKLRTFLRPDVEIFPKSAEMKAVPVRFTDLHKIRSPLGGLCEGFHMELFDTLIKDAIKVSDEKVEPQPLWEYPGVALTEEETIHQIDLVEPPESLEEFVGRYMFHTEGECNGIAVWVDWDMDGTPEHVITTGPMSPIVVGQKIDWDMYTRQGVQLLPRKCSGRYRLEYDFSGADDIFKSKMEQSHRS